MRNSKEKAYTSYKEYFKYNYNLELPAFSPGWETRRESRLPMLLNEKLAMSIITRITGIEFEKEYRYVAVCCICTTSDWTNLDDFDFEVTISKVIDGKTQWQETSFSCVMTFKNLQPVVNRQTNSTMCTIYRSIGDNVVDIYKEDLSAIELLKTYNSEVDSIGGTDILGVLDI